MEVWKASPGFVCKKKFAPRSTEFCVSQIPRQTEASFTWKPGLGLAVANLDVFTFSQQHTYALIAAKYERSSSFPWSSRVGRDEETCNFDV